MATASPIVTARVGAEALRYGVPSTWATDSVMGTGAPPYDATARSTGPHGARQYCRDAGCRRSTHRKSGRSTAHRQKASPSPTVSGKAGSAARRECTAHRSTRPWARDLQQPPHRACLNRSERSGGNASGGGINWVTSSRSPPVRAGTSGGPCPSVGALGIRPAAIGGTRPGLGESVEPPVAAHSAVSGGPALVDGTTKPACAGRDTRSC
jgi:hypothetical protein